jgi:hypothetical protein
VRLAAVQDLNYTQQGLLSQLAVTDPDGRVRVAAAHRVTDEALLQELLAAKDPEVMRAAKERLAGVAVKLALSRPLAACALILDAISEQKSLAELSLAAKDPAVRAAAFAKLIAQPEPSAAMLAMIAVQDAAGDLGRKAVALIGKRGLLKDVARKAKNAEVQAEALKRAETLEADSAKPSAEQSRKARLKALEPLAASATRLALASDWSRADGEWAELDGRLRIVLSEFTDLPLDELAQALDDRIQRSRREYQARRLSETERLAAALAARRAFLAELAAQTPDGGAEALARRQTLNERWQALAEVAPAERSVLDRDFQNTLVRLFPAAPAVVAIAATPTPVVLDEATRIELETLSTESETLAESTTWRDTLDRYRVLHKRWIQLAAPLPYDHPLKARFTVAYARFKERQRAWRETRDGDYRQRLQEMEKLAVEAEALAAVTPAESELRAHYDRLKRIQADWKAIGPMRVDLIQTVRARFRAACDAAYGPVRQLQEAEDWERFAHLAKAEALVAEVEALQTISDFAVVARTVKDLQARWKQVGPLPRDKREAAWTRFRTACDAQFDRCKGYFAELDGQRAGNLERKLALLAEVETLVKAAPVGLTGSPADLNARRTATERVKAIQQEWKTVGPMPRERDQEVWGRFRKACDDFFAQNRAGFSANHEEEVSNLNHKLALCVAAEDLAKDNEDPAKAQPAPERMRQIKDLQLSWKNIGHVPREQVEVIWTRFRKACDRVYDTLHDHLAERDKQQQENLAKKRALIAEAEAILKHENPGWFKDDLQQLQRQWREIGFVPRDNMDEVNRQFQEVCDKILAL